MRQQTPRLIREFLGSQSGFTLVELLVVVTIVVALAAASVVSVIQFAGKGEEGATATELDTVQSAMDAMMANTGTTAVSPNDLSTLGNGMQDFSSDPTEGPLVSYIRNNPTTYYYCWDSTGKAKQLTAAGSCPTGPY